MLWNSLKKVKSYRGKENVVIVVETVWIPTWYIEDFRKHLPQCDKSKCSPPPKTPNWQGWYMTRWIRHGHTHGSSFQKFSRVSLYILCTPLVLQCSLMTSTLYACMQSTWHINTSIYSHFGRKDGGWPQVSWRDHKQENTRSFWHAE